jgi:lipopolysaccharide biosynthesis glycosyltransferase
MQQADRNYCVIPREFLVALKSLERYHKSFYVQEFHILTDNVGLTWFLGLKILDETNVSRSSVLYLTIVRGGSIAT